MPIPNWLFFFPSLSSCHDYRQLYGFVWAWQDRKQMSLVIMIVVIDNTQSSSHHQHDCLVFSVARMITYLRLLGKRYCGKEDAPPRCNASEVLHAKTTTRSIYRLMRKLTSCVYHARTPVRRKILPSIHKMLRGGFCTECFGV